MTSAPVSTDFATAVRRLFVPEMGTEVVAPLLGLLVKLHRPRRVLEVGMGYTTPFLAAALAETEQLVDAEAAALITKTAPYLDRGRPLDDTWLAAEPALVNADFHREPYRPQFVAIDDLSIPQSSASQVLDVLGELDLLDRVTVVNADLHEGPEMLPAGFAPIDFAWVDAWECLYFFETFWDLINPDGGVLLMHYLMTYPEGETLLEYFADIQRTQPGEFEMVNLLESHKLTQNSITMLRRTSGTRDRQFADTDGAVRFSDQRRAASELLQRK